MTLLPLPLERVEVARVVELPEYDWRGDCRVPDCPLPAVDPHHIVPRRDGGRTWVLLDGVPVPNVAGLCRRHHDLVTDDKAAIVWDDNDGWSWAPNVRPDDLGRARPVQGTITLRPLFSSDNTKSSSGKCPTCGRRWPRPKPPPSERRRRRAFQVVVPDDDEDGAAIVSALLTEAAEQQGFDADDMEDVHYYALVGALHTFISSSKTGGKS